MNAVLVFPSPVLSYPVKNIQNRTLCSIYTQRTYIHNTTKKSTTEKIEGPRLISNKSDTCYSVGIGNFSNRSVYIDDMEYFKSYRFIKEQKIKIIRNITCWRFREKFDFSLKTNHKSSKNTIIYEIDDFFSIGKYSNSKATDEFSKGSIALSHFLKGFASLTKKNL